MRRKGNERPGDGGECITTTAAVNKDRVGVAADALGLIWGGGACKARAQQDSAGRCGAGEGSVKRGLRRSGGLGKPKKQRLLSGDGFGGFGLAGVGLGILAAEALDAAGGVDQFLLAGEEGVASGADFDADVALVGGTGHKSVAAGTVHAGFVVSRMDGWLHGTP